MTWAYKIHFISVTLSTNYIKYFKKLRIWWHRLFFSKPSHHFSKPVYINSFKLHYICYNTWMVINYIIPLLDFAISEASRGAGAQGCDSKRGRLWIPFPLEEMKYSIFPFSSLPLLSRQSAALSSTNQHPMPPEFGGKWERSVLTPGSLCILFTRDTA